MNGSAKTVVIVGADITGIATAALLSELGYAVTLIDRSDIAEETSKGNAAAGRRSCWRQDPIY